MQHQSSLVMTPMQGQLPPTTNIGTEVIQKYLDENKQLIMAILDNQNLGKLHECAQYQARLQSNLMYLAAIADAQPQISTPHPQMMSASHPMPHPVQFMQQQQQQQQQPNFSPRTCQQFQEQQAQQYQLNHLQMQAMQSHMGMSVANNNGIHAMRSDGGVGGGSFDGRGNNTSVSESGSLDGHRNSAACSDAENN